MTPCTFIGGVNIHALPLRLTLARFLTSYSERYMQITARWNVSAFVVVTLYNVKTGSIVAAKSLKATESSNVLYKCSVNVAVLFVRQNNLIFSKTMFGVI